jgi:hypothetical protein
MNGQDEDRNANTPASPEVRRRVPDTGAEETAPPPRQI